MLASVVAVFWLANARILMHGTELVHVHLVSLGVTVVMTAEVADSYEELRLSPHDISFLADGIILQRYVEMEGALRKVMTVVKMRGCDHGKEIRFYDIGKDGLVMGEPANAYEHLLVGKARDSRGRGS